MDLQQVLSLVVVAAAAAFIAARLIRRRRAGKFKECADCVHHEGEKGFKAAVKK